MRFKKIIELFLLALVIAGAGACVVVGELTEESRTVALDKAKTVELKLELGAGVLRVQGGARELMEGYFMYNIEKWKPEIEYSITGSRGILSVQQGRCSGIPVGKKRNEWEISLNSNVPMDIEVNFGAGKGVLDLRGLMLESVDIDMGVGDLTVDLSGQRDRNMDVVIDGGVGSATIYLPDDVGVRVSVDKGIGSVSARDLIKKGDVFINEVYEKADIVIDVDIDAGIGSIDLKVK